MAAESGYVNAFETPYHEELARLVCAHIPFNDRDALLKAVEEHGHESAMLILEPVNYNCAGIKPEPGYLEFCREITRDAGMVLFFDEIQSVFKRSLGGAQQDFGVVPDVCTIGKSLGGGLPLSAFCGKAQIMDMFQPIGPVQHSGTFNAHLVPVLAGLAFLREAMKPEFYPTLRQREQQFHDYGGGPLHHGYSIQHSAEDIAQVLDVLETVLIEFKDEI